MAANIDDPRKASSSANNQDDQVKGAAEQADALGDDALGAVSGGGSDIVITKTVDKTSPK